MSLEVEIIKPAIGAKIKLDRSMIGDPAISQELKALLEKHTVLVFPCINLTDDEQLGLTDALGGRVNISAAAGRSNADEVYQVTLDKSSSVEPVYVMGTFFWHMDGLTVNVAPPKATVLSARRLSAKGGQTEFASTRAAYDALPPEEQLELADVQVLHSASASVREIVAAENLSPAQRALTHVHPLVLTQADGSKSLLIGATGDQVIGYDQAEGRALLARLLDWTAQPAFSYRHYWQEGDCVVWDNTSALHRVIPYDKNSGRMMHRTVIAGREVVA